MSNANRLQAFLNEYTNERTKKSSNFLSLLDPVAESVKMISQDGGADFIKTLSGEDVYNYTILISDIVRLSLQKPKRTHKAANVRTKATKNVSKVLQPQQSTEQEEPCRYAFPKQTEVFERFSNITPADPALMSTIKSFLESYATEQQAARNLFQNINAPHYMPQQQRPTAPATPAISELPAQSTPIRPSAHMLPRNVAEHPFISDMPPISRQRTTFTPQIRISDNNLESLASSSAQVPATPMSAREFIRISQQRIDEARLFRESLQDFHLPNLSPNHDFASEMQQFLNKNKMKRQNELRQQKKMSIPQLKTKITPVTEIVPSTAEINGLNQNNWPVKITETHLIDKLLTTLKDVTVPKELVQEMMVAVIDQIRAGASNAPSILPPPQQQNQDSNALNPPNLLPRNSDRIPEINLLDAINSPRPAPISIPQLVEQLTDVEFPLSPMQLRPGQLPPGHFAGQTHRPPSRKRRAVALDNDAITHQVSESAEVIVGISPPEEHVAIDGDNENNLKLKFKLWKNAIMAKAKSNVYRHSNCLTSFSEIEGLYKETHYALTRMSTEAHLPINLLIPSNIDRKTAAQRAIILLELNTKGLVELERGTGCMAIGVKNSSFDGALSSVPAPLEIPTEPATLMDTLDIGLESIMDL